MSGDNSLEEIAFHDLRTMAKDKYGLSFGQNVKKVEIIEAIRIEETGQAEEQGEPGDDPYTQDGSEIPLFSGGPGKRAAVLLLTPAGQQQ